MTEPQRAREDDNTSAAVHIRQISPSELDAVISALVDLLRESVNEGAALGFLPPLARDAARAYWLSLRSEIQSGSRVLLGAFADDRLVGAGQLALPAWWTNGRHRAELQKLFVTSARRRQGVGTSLIAGLHAAAWQRGRSLLLIGARRGDPAERLYHRLGYREVGVIPGYSVDTEGQRYDNVLMCRELSWNWAATLPHVVKHTPRWHVALPTPAPHRLPP